MDLEQENDFLFSLIAAVDENFAIGYKNNLLCKIPFDMRRFRYLTMGKKVLVGKKTFQTLSNGLPGRNVIVVTHEKNFSLCKDSFYELNSNVQVCCDLELFLCQNENSCEEIFVIGGAEIYQQSFPYASKIYLTCIHKKFSYADAFFPDFFNSSWEKLSSKPLFYDDLYFHYDFFWR